MQGDNPVISWKRTMGTSRIYQVGLMSQSYLAKKECRKKKVNTVSLVRIHEQEALGRKLLTFMSYISFILLTYIKFKFSNCYIYKKVYIKYMHTLYFKLNSTDEFNRNIFFEAWLMPQSSLIRSLARQNEMACSGSTFHLTGSLS